MSGRPTRRRVRLGGAVVSTPTAYHPVLDLRRRLRGLPRSRRPRREAADHEQQDHGAEHQQPEQHDERAGRARHAVALEPADGRRGDDRDDTARRTTGSVIVWVTPRPRSARRASTPTPTRSQEAMPRSRSQRGAENTADIARSCSVSSWTTTCSRARRSRSCVAVGRGRAAAAPERRQELMGGLGRAVGRRSRG